MTLSLFRPTDRFMNGATVPDDILVGNDELLQRRIDVVEVDVGDKAVDGRIDARWLLAVQIALRRDQGGERPQIGDAARHGGIGIEAADALIVVTLVIEGLRPGEAVFG